MTKLFFIEFILFLIINTSVAYVATNDLSEPAILGWVFGLAILVVLHGLVNYRQGMLHVKRVYGLDQDYD